MTIYERLRTVLEPVGVPAFAHVWTPQLSPDKPDTYITYQEMLNQDELYADDAPIMEGHYLAVSVWSDTGTAKVAARVRAALRGAGFIRRDERDIYEPETQTYHRAMTWVYFEEG